MTELASKQSESGALRLSDRNFKQIADTLLEESGIVLAEGKRSMVFARLAKRLRACGLSDFDAYCDYVSSDRGAEERFEMLQSLTTNVTSFFRESHHFDQLRQDFMPSLMARAKDGQRVRIWSAACSQGHEPYSIAMSLLTAFPDAHKYDVKILATDIDEKVLSIGKQGVYTRDAIDAVPDAMQRKFLSPVAPGSNEVQCSDELKSLITFKPLNLIKPWPVRGPFDVIFCRNVVIYFNEETKSLLWQRFAEVLRPSGWLCVGHSERVAGPASSQFQTTGFTTYQRVGR